MSADPFASVRAVYQPGDWARAPAWAQARIGWLETAVDQADRRTRLLTLALAALAEGWLGLCRAVARG